MQTDACSKVHYSIIVLFYGATSYFVDGGTKLTVQLHVS